MPRRKPKQTQKYPPRPTMGRVKTQVWIDALPRYARVYNGAVVKCTPPLDERNDRAAKGLPPLKPKVIFNSRADAEAYARILVAQGQPAQYAYPCPFSRTGHAHLSARRAGTESRP